MDPAALGMPPTGLSGKVAIVTGVSRPNSIGASICRAFASCGVDLLFTHWLPFDTGLKYDVDEAAVAAIEEDLRSHGTRIESISLDLSAPKAAARLLDLVVSRLGVPSILVNNAAHWSRNGIDTLDATILDAHYAVNVRGMALLCAEFVRHYPGGPGGRIINLTSGQAITPMPNELAYATTKGAVEAFTFSLASGVASLGITVNAIDPGGTDTGWMSEEVKAAIEAQMTMGRMGQPEDAARLVAFLASDAAEWITGQVIRSRGA